MTNIHTSAIPATYVQRSGIAFCALDPNSTRASLTFNILPSTGVPSIASIAALACPPSGIVTKPKPRRNEPAVTSGLARQRYTSPQVFSCFPHELCLRVQDDLPFPPNAGDPPLGQGRWLVTFRAR